MPEEPAITYPVNLLLHDRLCLVIGGGKVATRKVETLLNVKANVTVIGETATQQIKQWADEKIINLELKAYDSDVLSNAFLVFVATDDRALNATVVTHCQTRNIICCAVDKNWRQGDFVTPASFVNNNLTISVSSGGTDRRRARLLKQSLSRHAEMMGHLDFLVIGTDHSLLSLNDREAYHLLPERLEHVGRQLKHLWGIQGFMILNTCNRVELWAVLHDTDDLSDLILDVFGFSGLSPDKYFVKTGAVAFAHTCMVTAGMLSQTPGEYHIVSQVKESLKVASERNWSGAIIQEWTDGVLKVSKQIRQLMPDKERGLEIEDVALHYISNIANLPEKANVAIIGTGDVGKGLIAQLPNNHHCTWVYRNTQPETARDVTWLAYKDLPETLDQFDLVISAAAANDPNTPLISNVHVLATKNNRPCTYVDLAVPRSLDSKLSENAEHVVLVDMDELKSHYFKAQDDYEDNLRKAQHLANNKSFIYDSIIENI